MKQPVSDETRAAVGHFFVFLGLVGCCFLVAASGSAPHHALRPFDSAPMFFLGAGEVEVRKIHHLRLTWPLFTLIVAAPLALGIYWIGATCATGIFCWALVVNWKLYRV